MKKKLNKAAPLKLEEMHYRLARKFIHTLSINQKKNTREITGHRKMNYFESINKYLYIVAQSNQY